MRVENEDAYVLEARPYRETSLLVELFTLGHGRIVAVARGVRGESRSQRLRRSALEPFQHLRIAFSGRGEVLSLGAFETVSRTLRPTGPALFAALYVNELVQKLTGRGDPVPGLFQRYAEWLDELGALIDCAASEVDSNTLHREGGSDDREGGSDVRGGGSEVGEGGSDAAVLPVAAARLAWSLRRFERDLLAELGYALALDHRADSGDALEPHGDYAFDPEHGALPWHSASVWPRVRGSTLLAWAGESPPEPDIGRALKHLARIIIRHHLGGTELRAWRLAAQWRT